MAQKRKSPEIIDLQLFDNEELVWWGQPVAIHSLRKVDIVGTAMSLFIVVFAIFFYLQAREMFTDNQFRSFGQPSMIETIMPFFFTLVPALMVLTGLWNISEPIRNWIIANRTYYALTNRRALVIKDLFATDVRSFYDENIHRLQVKNYGGVGDIIFATETVTSQYKDHNNGFRVSFNDNGVNFGNQTRTTTTQVSHGFHAIRDVRVVEDYISQIFFDDSEEKDKAS